MGPRRTPLAAPQIHRREPGCTIYRKTGGDVGIGRRLTGSYVTKPSWATHQGRRLMEMGQLQLPWWTWKTRSGMRAGAWNLRSRTAEGGPARLFLFINSHHFPNSCPKARPDRQRLLQCRLQLTGPVARPW